MVFTEQIYSDKLTFSQWVVFVRREVFYGVLEAMAILQVVFGHVLKPVMANVEANDSGIYFFHMPLVVAIFSFFLVMRTTTFFVRYDLNVCAEAAVFLWCKRSNYEYKG